MRRGQLIESED